MKLIEIKNTVEDYLYITYNFTTTCNFNCNYCWPGAHDGKYRWPELDVITKINLHDPAFVDKFSLQSVNLSSLCTRQFCDCTSDIKVSKRSKMI